MFTFKCNPQLSEEENSRGKDCLEGFNEIYNVTCEIFCAFKGRSGKRLVAEVVEVRVLGEVLRLQLGAAGEAAGAQGYNDRVFFLTPSASSTAVIEDKDNVFQVCFTDPNQGSASAQYIADHKLGTKVAVIYNNADVYSTGIRDTFVEKGAELGLEIVSEETFTDETTDFTVQVGKAQEAGAEIVFLPMYYTPASLILKTAADKNYSPIFFGVDGMDGILSVEGFDTSLAEGVMLLTPFVATSEDEKVQNFVAKYQEKFNETPIQFAADAYDGMYILVAAAEKAGITSDMAPEEACDLLIAAMLEIEVDGLTGTMTWDESGAVTKTPMAATIVNGVYVFED